jgi:hypothetical protein
MKHALRNGDFARTNRVNTGQLLGERWQPGRKKGKRVLCTLRAKRFRGQRLANEPTATITI